jgi:hypothetical protein
MAEGFNPSAVQMGKAVVMGGAGLAGYWRSVSPSL